MKSAFSIAKVAVLLVAFIISSCKKNDNTPPPVNSASLSPGKAAASFKTNVDFGNSNSFNVRNTATTFATSESSAGLRVIRLQVGEEDGTRVVYFDLGTINNGSFAGKF